MSYVLNVQFEKYQLKKVVVDRDSGIICLLPFISRLAFLGNKIAQKIIILPHATYQMNVLINLCALCT